MSCLQPGPCPYVAEGVPMSCQSCPYSDGEVSQ